MTRRFVLVDDDIDDADIFCEALGRVSSTKCFKVENGLELFSFLSDNKISHSDIIFLDINMPKMDGWECLKKLKSSPGYSSIPVIMYSTSSAKKDIDKAYSLGVQLFITKPEEFGELSNILGIVATGSNESLRSDLEGFKSVKLM